MKQHHVRQSLTRLAGVALLAATVAFSGAAAAQGPPQTTFAMTAAFDYGAPFLPAKVWQSDGLLHWQRAPFSAPLVSGPFAGGTVSIVSDGVFDLTTFGSNTHGTFAIAAPGGASWSGRYTDRSDGGVLSGNAVGHASDGSTLTLKYSATGPFVGVVIITYEVTIING